MIHSFVQATASGDFGCVAAASGARSWTGWGASGAGQGGSVTSVTGNADSKGDSSVATGCRSIMCEQRKSSSLKTLGLNGYIPEARKPAMIFFGVKVNGKALPTI